MSPFFALLSLCSLTLTSCLPAPPYVLSHSSSAHTGRVDCSDALGGRAKFTLKSSQNSFNVLLSPFHFHSPPLQFTPSSHYSSGRLLSPMSMHPRKPHNRNTKELEFQASERVRLLTLALLFVMRPISVQRVCRRQAPRGHSRQGWIKQGTERYVVALRPWNCIVRCSHSDPNDDFSFVRNKAAENPERMNALLALNEKRRQCVCHSFSSRHYAL